MADKTRYSGNKEFFKGPLERERESIEKALGQIERFERGKIRTLQRKESEYRFAEKLGFEIENLLSPDNLMDADSIKVLQDKLNKYVYGEDKLKVDGNLGPKTLKGIRKYQNERRYWGGHSKVDISPLRTFHNYNVKIRKPNLDEEYEEDLREGGGDQGGY